MESDKFAMLGTCELFTISENFSLLRNSETLSIIKSSVSSDLKTNQLIVVNTITLVILHFVKNISKASILRNRL